MFQEVNVSWTVKNSLTNPKSGITVKKASGGGFDTHYFPLQIQTAGENKYHHFFLAVANHSHSKLHSGN